MSRLVSNGVAGEFTIALVAPTAAAALFQKIVSNRGFQFWWVFRHPLMTIALNEYDGVRSYDIPGMTFDVFTPKATGLGCRKEFSAVYRREAALQQCVCCSTQ